MFSNLVVGLKETGGHDALIELAKSTASAGARIHLVTMVMVATSEDELARLQEVEESLARYAQGLRDDGFAASFEAGLVVAAAATDLLRIARERDADLIVLGLAKRSRVGKAVMGSDAQRVLLGAPCPVLASPLYSRS